MRKNCLTKYVAKDSIILYPWIARGKRDKTDDQIITMGNDSRL